MARSLSNLLVRGVTGLHAAHSLRTVVSGSLYQHGMRYSTTDDSGSHEDFRPTTKVVNSGLSTKDIVEQDVKENPVMIYMKGIPEAPQCGFSSLAVRVLKQYTIGLHFHRYLLRGSLLEDQILFSTCISLGS
uniref:Monothiol glutaredoxin-S15, mitochondrial-like n=1 Tax=Nelumbo nucifera TaxID=4432 RepID=A0A822ZK54_NELNU|nr:TPA_asm: hypothetical protein HUJ06_001626 [Nelumbo nucifera]